MFCVSLKNLNINISHDDIHSCLLLVAAVLKELMKSFSIPKSKNLLKLRIWHAHSLKWAKIKSRELHCYVKHNGKYHTEMSRCNIAGVKLAGCGCKVELFTLVLARDYFCICFDLHFCEISDIYYIYKLWVSYNVFSYQ